MTGHRSVYPSQILAVKNPRRFKLSWAGKWMKLRQSFTRDAKASPAEFGRRRERSKEN